MPLASPRQLRRSPWLRIVLTSVLVFLGGASRVWSAPIPLPRDDQLLVNLTIKDGVRYLKVNQQETGSWAKEGAGHAVGYAALPGLTLLECGVPATDKQVKQAAQFVRSKWADIDQTYEASLAILFLDRLGNRKDRVIIQKLALRLIAGQSPTGGWCYRCPVLSSTHQRQLWAVLRRPKKLRRRASIPEALQGLPVLTPPAELALDDPLDKTNEPIWGTTDNSNTQFAMLAIWASRRHGVPVDRTLNLLVRRFHKSQNPNGSWDYRFKRGGGRAEAPAMDCVGLLGLALSHRHANESLAWLKPVVLIAARAACHWELPGVRARLVWPPLIAGLWDRLPGPKKQAQDPKILNGFVALNPHIGKPAMRMRGLAMPNLYFLWSVERVAVLYGLEKIGDKDWYRWGAEMLVANQQGEGHWEGGGYPGSSPTIDTCLALLFLKRANLARDLAKRLPFKPKDLAEEIARKLPSEPVKKPEPPSRMKSPTVVSSPTPKLVPEKKPESQPAQPAGAHSSPPKERAAPSEEHGSNVWGWIVAAVGLLLLLAGGIFLFAYLRQNPEQDERPRKKKKAARHDRAAGHGTRSPKKPSLEPPAIEGA